MENTPIDPKDLCVGSYVQQENGKALVVTGISGMRVFLNAATGVLKYNDAPFDGIRPIPVTPEWLVRLGFDGGVIGIDSQFVHPKLSPYIRGKVYQDEWRWTLWGTKETYGIDSVHYLQSLIWQLERVWLTLSPETT